MVVPRTTSLLFVTKLVITMKMFYYIYMLMNRDRLTKRKSTTSCTKFRWGKIKSKLHYSWLS